MLKFGITPCFGSTFTIMNPNPIESNVVKNYVFPCILVDGKYEVTSILIEVFQDGKFNICIQGEVNPRTGFFAVIIRNQVISKTQEGLKAFLIFEGVISD